MQNQISSIVTRRTCSFIHGGIWVTSSPRDPRFAGSNLAEVDGFFQDAKILSTSSPGRTSSWGPESQISGSSKDLKPEKIDLWAKFNLHIHVLLIPKFGGAQNIFKGCSALGSNHHPIKTNTNRPQSEDFLKPFFSKHLGPKRNAPAKIQFQVHIVWRVYCRTEVILFYIIVWRIYCRIEVSIFYIIFNQIYTWVD